jgi:hypothetical protein
MHRVQLRSFVSRKPRKSDFGLGDFVLYAIATQATDH